VNWPEQGRRTDQSVQIHVHPGDVFRLDLRPLGKRSLQDEINAGLAGLSPEDRKLAEAQGYCAVQDSMPLGVLGVPVKVLLKGQPVFVSCPECVARAEANPDQILARASELRAKKGSPQAVGGR
jgi:hypothetical protein